MFGRRGNVRKDGRDRPVDMVVDPEYAAAMQKVAQTSKFGVSVSVQGEGATYQSQTGSELTVQPGRKHVTIRHTAPASREGLTPFYKAAKSLKRHEKKQRNRQG